MPNIITTLCVDDILLQEQKKNIKAPFQQQVTVVDISKRIFK